MPLWAEHNFLEQVHPGVTQKYCDRNVLLKLGIYEKYIGKPQKRKKIILKVILDADPLFKRHFSDPVQGLSE